MIASQRRKHYYGHDDPNVPPVTVGPDIVSDIYYDIGDCNTPISGYPILYPILTPISGYNYPDIGIPDIGPDI